jgi:glycosyltransferase involved in cell wall biosynthesis
MEREGVNGERTGKKRVLALVTDAYGGYGGIAAYNRDVIDALAEDETIAGIVVLPRLVPQPVTGVPEKVEFVRASAKGAVRFVLSALREGLFGGRFDLIYCAHINHVPLAWLLSKLTGAPWALCLYGYEGWQRTGRSLVDRLTPKADHIISLSQLTLDRFLKIWPVDPARCTVVPNAIHLEEFAAGPKNPALEARYCLAGKRVLMTFGRMDPREQAKGFDRVIALLPRLSETVPNIAYLACGDGGDRPRLEALAEEAGVRDRVVFAGMIDEAEKADHYRLADLYVMPSKYEGFGFVFLEAMACGIPVVASTIDGGREAVRLGEIGQMVDPYDADALAQAILRGLEQPRGIPEGLAYFSFANFRDRIQAALRPLLAGKAA